MYYRQKFTLKNIVLSVKMSKKIDTLILAELQKHTALLEKLVLAAQKFNSPVVDDPDRCKNTLERIIELRNIHFNKLDSLEQYRLSNSTSDVIMQSEVDVRSNLLKSIEEIKSLNVCPYSDYFELFSRERSSTIECFFHK
jgi:hypothetical protein